MSDQGGASLTPLGKILSFLVIIGLIAVGGYVIWQKSAEPSRPVQPVQPAAPGGSAQTPAPKPAPGDAESAGVEAADPKGITTVSEYKYVAADRLPQVKGASAYKWDPQTKTLRFSYNVWAGWLPIIAANHGTAANDQSVFWKKYGFRVEMVLMDDPVAARDAFATGDVHTLWGTLDMIVLFAPGLMADSRTAPRVFQQIDWSSGGDGIVVRDTIKSVADLKGKSIAYALNSPSEYYLTSLLLSAGLRPDSIRPKNTATAFEAAAAFVADRSVDACVSWAPDIYTIPEKVARTRILSSTADANKLIADVYAVRADFARDHPEVVMGLVAGIFEGMDMVKQDPGPACEWMAKAFGMQADDVMKMRNDFHSTNFAENAQFFLNASNPTNFERTWKNASYVYSELNRLDRIVPFDQVMDFSVIKDLQAKGLFSHQKDESVATFTPGFSKKSLTAEAPILTQTIRVNFYPNSSNPFELARDEYGNVVKGKLYDPNVTGTLDKVASLAGQFARAIVLIEGHTDGSMRGKVPVQAVKDLSTARAQAIKQALIDKYKFDPNKFIVEGKGWDEPADMHDPDNHALNRRVEISVFPPEEQ